MTPTPADTAQDPLVGEPVTGISGAHRAKVRDPGAGISLAGQLLFLQ